MINTLQSTTINSNQGTNLKPINITCDLCKNFMKEWGFIHIEQLPTTLQISFFCSAECRKKFKWTKICVHCGIEFNTFKRGRSKQRFCSRQCHSLNSKVKCGICLHCGNQIEGIEKNKRNRKKFCSKECMLTSRSYKYKTHYFCDNCHKWIKIEDAIKRDDVKRDPYICPKRNCNGNKLRTRSNLASLNQRRKNVKWID
jgi:hypothetical protein